MAPRWSLNAIMNGCSTPGHYEPSIRSPPLSRYFWILAVLAAIVLLAPIRAGDLAGYDDARYALVAKHVVLSGHWLEIESNGGPALEHPPLFSWIASGSFYPLRPLRSARQTSFSSCAGWESFSWWRGSVAG